MSTYDKPDSFGMWGPTSPGGFGEPMTPRRPEPPEGICWKEYSTPESPWDIRICRRPKGHSGRCGLLTEAEGVALLQAKQGAAAAKKLEDAVQELGSVTHEVREASAKAERNLAALIESLPAEFRALERERSRAKHRRRWFRAST